MGTDREVAKIIETARETERQGRDFYARAAAGTADPLARRMFESLAEAEKQHLELIEELAAGRFRGAAYARGQFPGKLRTVFAGMSGASGPAAAGSDVEVLKLGIAMEDKSLAFYRTWAGKAASEAARGLCARLAAEEEDHWRVLQSTLSYLEETGNWFMVQERWGFDGG